MILGIGIDAIKTSRFCQWHSKPIEQQQKIFSADEIAYCTSENPAVSAERFAVRFAAREAFFKAYQAALHTYGISNKQTLLSVNKHITITRNSNGLPLIKADWSKLLPEHSAPTVHLSLTHTDDTATAIVLIEQRQ